MSISSTDYDSALCDDECLKLLAVASQTPIATAAMQGSSNGGATKFYACSTGSPRSSPLLRLKALSLKDLLALAEDDTLKYYYIANEQPSHKATESATSVSTVTTTKARTTISRSSPICNFSQILSRSRVSNKSKQYISTRASNNGTMAYASPGSYSSRTDADSNDYYYYECQKLSREELNKSSSSNKINNYSHNCDYGGVAFSGNFSIDNSLAYAAKLCQPQPSLWHQPANVVSTRSDRSKSINRTASYLIRECHKTGEPEFGGTDCNTPQFQRVIPIGSANSRNHRGLSVSPTRNRQFETSAIDFDVRIRIHPSADSKRPPPPARSASSARSPCLLRAHRGNPTQRVRPASIASELRLRNAVAYSFDSALYRSLPHSVSQSNFQDWLVGQQLRDEAQNSGYVSFSKSNSDSSTCLNSQCNDYAAYSNSAGFSSRQQISPNPKHSKHSTTNNFAIVRSKPTIMDDYAESMSKVVSYEKAANSVHGHRMNYSRRAFSSGALKASNCCWERSEQCDASSDSQPTAGISSNYVSNVVCEMTPEEQWLSKVCAQSSQNSASALNRNSSTLTNNGGSVNNISSDRNIIYSSSDLDASTNQKSILSSSKQAPTSNSGFSQQQPRLTLPPSSKRIEYSDCGVLIGPASSNGKTITEYSDYADVTQRTNAAGAFDSNAYNLNLSAKNCCSASSTSLYGSSFYASSGHSLNATSPPSSFAATANDHCSSSSNSNNRKMSSKSAASTQKRGVQTAIVAPIPSSAQWKGSGKNGVSAALSNGGPSCHGCQFGANGAVIAPLMRQRSVCQDDSAVHIFLQGKGRSATMDSYQLSEDFRQKQVEMLERKYGGHLRTRRAATIIQRGWRKYQMAKKFERLRRVNAQHQSRQLRLRRHVTTGEYLLGTSHHTKSPAPEMLHSEANAQPVAPLKVSSGTNSSHHLTSYHSTTSSHHQISRVSPHVRVTNQKLLSESSTSPVRAYTKIDTSSDNVMYTVVDKAYVSAAPKLNLQPYSTGKQTSQQGASTGRPLVNVKAVSTAGFDQGVVISRDATGNLVAQKPAVMGPLRSAMSKPPGVRVLRQRSVSTDRANDRFNRFTAQSTGIGGSSRAVRAVQLLSPDSSASDASSSSAARCLFPGPGYVSAANAQFQVASPVFESNGPFAVPQVPPHVRGTVASRPKAISASGKLICSDGTTTSSSPQHHNSSAFNQLYIPLPRQPNLLRQQIISSEADPSASVLCQFGDASDRSAQRNQPQRYQHQNDVWVPQTIVETSPVKSVQPVPGVKVGSSGSAFESPSVSHNASSMFSTPPNSPDRSFGANSTVAYERTPQPMNVTLQSQESALNSTAPIAVPDYSGTEEDVCSPRTQVGAFEMPNNNNNAIHLSKSVPSAVDSSGYLRQWVRQNAVAQAKQQQLAASDQQTPCASVQQQRETAQDQAATSPGTERRISEIERKRQYRIALNFFNKKPDRGVQFLVDFGFVDGTPGAVAKFLVTRKGLSKQTIGEYLGNLQNPFNMAVLDCFATLMNLATYDLDVGLRKFLSHFRLPGEAQKIERIMEVFSRRYCECNPNVASKFRNLDTVFILAFAIIMLNTDLHSPNVKADRKMKLEDFLKNLKGIDGGQDIETTFLVEIYQRVKATEFRSGSDHVTQVMKVDQTIVGKKPILALPHRRLVCYCRLYEVPDPHKKQGPNAHQREIFLFNDMILVSKILSRKKNTVTYSYRQSHSLVGMQVQLHKSQHHSFALKITHTLENKVFYFNARNEEDRAKFMEDLKESIMESDEMEALRIEVELEKQKFVTLGFASGPNSRFNTLSRAGGGANADRDSGLAEMDGRSSPNGSGPTAANQAVVAGGGAEEIGLDGQPIGRQPSITSLDSGMSSTASTGSRESSPHATVSGNAAGMIMADVQQQQLPPSSLDLADANKPHCGSSMMVAATPIDGNIPPTVTNASGGTKNSSNGNIVQNETAAKFSLAGLFGAARTKRPSAPNLATSANSNSDGNLRN